MTDALKKALGKSFNGSVIEDPILEPYFIIYYGPGDFALNRKRVDVHGNLKFSTLRYPGTFCGCLDSIAKEKMCDKKEYNSIQEYIDTWKEISTSIRTAYKDWNVDDI